MREINTKKMITADLFGLCFFYFKDSCLHDSVRSGSRKNYHQTKRLLRFVRRSYVEKQPPENFSRVGLANMPTLVLAQLWLLILIIITEVTMARLCSSRRAPKPTKWKTHLHLILYVGAGVFLEDSRKVYEYLVASSMTVMKIMRVMSLSKVARSFSRSRGFNSTSSIPDCRHLS